MVPKLPNNPYSEALTRSGGIAVLVFATVLLTACGGRDDDGNDLVGGDGAGNDSNSYTVTATAVSNGSISPGIAEVNEGSTTSFTVTPESGYGIDTVTGCSGSLSGNTYTTGIVTVDCTVIASFVALPRVSVAGASVLEGDTGSADLTFTVSLSEQANGDVNVDYATSDGSASSASDYTATSGTLTINSGTTSNTINVSVNGDTDGEDDETITLTLSNVSANATLGASGATGTIQTDDPTAPLNDTGITTCSDASSNALACPQTGFEGQDAESGRDDTANDDSDGHAGFSFTKVCNSGELAGEGSCPADPSQGSGADNWACNQDNVTGLMWEVKTNDGGLRDTGKGYNWYNSDDATNGGDAGFDSADNCLVFCDTEDYVGAVNSATLCGYSDWRMPSQGELLSIVDYSTRGPAIDSSWFPNTRAVSYWSSIPDAGNAVIALAVDFSDGGISHPDKTTGFSVRLVRGGL